jgi:hypothetical protein
MADLQFWTSLAVLLTFIYVLARVLAICYE